MTPDELIAELNASNPRGRGGAFFPTGRKWSFVPKPDQEPNPHLPGRQRRRVGARDVQGPGDHVPRPAPVPRGLPDRGHGRSSRRTCSSTSAASTSASYEILVAALEQLRKGKHLGGMTIVLHRGAGAYICGEETALLESLEGKRGQPRTKPPFPRDRRPATPRPTVVNNVETHRDGAPDHRDGRRRVREGRRPGASTGTARLLALRATSSTAGQLRGRRTGSRCAT